MLGLEMHVEPGLSGPDHGQADGQPWDEIKAAFGGPPQSDPDRLYAPGSETWNQYLTRAGATLSKLIERQQGQRILIAGHGETTDAAAARQCAALPAVTWTELMNWAEIHHILTSRYAADGRYPRHWHEARPASHGTGARTWP